MTIKQIFIIAIIINVVGFTNYSLAKTNKQSLNCTVTKLNKQNDKGPYSFHHSNNLLRTPGKATLAEGEKILLKGKILDNRCLPISDAVIELWQTNNFGIYQYKKPNKVLHDQNFASTGKAVTNNLGEFNFITIFSPKINIRIRHHGFKAIETYIDLNNLNFTINDIKDMEIFANEMHARKIYNYTIVLDYKNNYKTF